MMMSTEEPTTELMEDEVATNETDSNETSAVEDHSNLTEEESQGERGHLPLHELKKKTLTKNHKKMLNDSLGDMEKEDCAMWSVLQGDVKRPRRTLPKGCRSFVMEVFAGAATLSRIAASMGLAVAPPIDIEHDARYDLLQSKNRDMLWDTIEDEDPFLFVVQEEGEVVCPCTSCTSPSTRSHDGCCCSRCQGSHRARWSHRLQTLAAPCRRCQSSCNLGPCNRLQMPSNRGL